MEPAPAEEIVYTYNGYKAHECKKTTFTNDEIIDINDKIKQPFTDITMGDNSIVWIYEVDSKTYASGFVMPGSGSSDTKWYFVHLEIDENDKITALYYYKCNLGTTNGLEYNQVVGLDREEGTISFVSASVGIYSTDGTCILGIHAPRDGDKTCCLPEKSFFLEGEHKQTNDVPVGEHEIKSFGWTPEPVPDEP